jgi:hypothetical protein
VLRSPQALAAAIVSARTEPLECVALDEVRRHAPVPVPPSVRDLMAFEEHVVTSRAAFGLEVDPVWYEIPVFYFSNRRCCIVPSLSTASA